MKKYTNKILLGIISLIIIIAIALATISATFFNTSALKDNSTISITQETISNWIVESQNISAISTKGSGNIIISPGSFNIEAEDTSPKSLVIKIDHGLLELTNKSSKNLVKIQLPELKSITAAGSSNIKVNDFSEKQIELNLSGVSKLTVSNSSFANVAINNSGASDIDFKHCRLKAVAINASGDSLLMLDSFDDGTLSGLVSGFAVIKYTGALTNNWLKTSGSVTFDHELSTDLTK